MQRPSLPLAVATLAAGVLLGLGFAQLRPGAVRAEDQEPAAKSAPAEKTGPAAPAAGKQGTVRPLPDDPAFDRHVSLLLLGQAIHDADAAMLTDVALQLAEGERVLGRPHRALAAGGLLRLACRAAEESADRPSLERLAKAAEARGDRPLLEQVQAARKQAGSPRPPEPALLVAVAATTPEAFALYHGCLRDIRSARLAGDLWLLAALREAVPALPGLAEAQRQQLAREAKVVPCGPEEARAQQACRRLLKTCRQEAGSAPACGDFLPRTALVLGRRSAGRCGADASARRLAAKLTAASRDCDGGDPTCS